MLIGLTVVGCSLGLLARLFHSQPQVAISLLGIASIGLPFLLATATLIHIGAQLKQRALIVWGAFLLLSPFIGVLLIYAAQAIARPSGGALAMISNKRLIETELPRRIDDASVWNELKHRAEQDQLSGKEGDAVAGAVAQQFSTKAPYGWQQPLHWKSGFFEVARTKQLLSQKSLIELSDGFFGTQPKVDPINVSANSRPQLNVDFGSHWNSESHHGLGVVHLWDIKSMKVDDGTPVKISTRSRRFSNNWHGVLDSPLPAGARQLTLTFDIAYVDADKMIGLKEDKLPASRWPKAIKRWTKDVTVPLDGSNPNKPIGAKPKLVTDPSKRPNFPQVKRLAIQRDEGNLRLVAVQLETPDNLSSAISCDVFLDTGAEQIAIGKYWAYPHGNGLSYGGNELVSRGHKIPPNLQKATLLFEPNVDLIKPILEERADGRKEVEVWGVKETVDNLMVERLDLD